ncbi:hypothetical protein [Microbacterium karelineae]|uniref:hypothetical protein n=1 Tax=Microbacterium karelineae TaxID=2654283 RepID=UPI0012EADCFC|nr:hypothetical protein [Microbacterium karelineae]
MSDLIPDDIDTRIAIKSAERDISTAGGRQYGPDSLHEREGLMLRIAADEVMEGRPLAVVRSWCLRAALIRDGLVTSAEREAAAA